jgi:hypothetical protein
MGQQPSRKTLDDWQIVARLLPSGWQGMARQCGALRRARGIRDAPTLLRTLMIHLADGCSLVETAIRASEAGLCQISPVALFKRLRASEQWLRWLAYQLWQGGGRSLPRSQRQFRAIDATVVCESGPTGSHWRIHYSLNLGDLQCDHFELTDVRGGETFRRIPVRRGDVMMGDRAYGTPPGVGYVVGHQGDVLVRINPRMMPLFTATGRKLSVLGRLRQLRVGEPADWPVRVHGPDGEIAARLVAIKRSQRAAERVRTRIQARARRRQRPLSAKALELAGYVMLLTTLPQAECTSHQALERYRLRWQIELAIKRMKSILGLGQLPKQSDASSRAWLHGKLFVALLLERLLREAEALSPWGYPLSPASESLAGNTIHVS